MGKDTGTTCISGSVSKGDSDTFSMESFSVVTEGVTNGAMDACDSRSDPREEDRESNPHVRAGIIFLVVVNKTTFTSPDSENTTSLLWIWMTYIYQHLIWLMRKYDLRKDGELIRNIMTCPLQEATEGDGKDEGCICHLE